MSVARVGAVPGLGGVGGLRAEFAAGTETPHPSHRKKQALPAVHPNSKPCLLECACWPFAGGPAIPVEPPGAAQGNEFRLTDFDGGGCRWRFWMCSEDLDPQRLYDPAPKCHCSVQEMLLGARWGAAQSNPLT